MVEYPDGSKKVIVTGGLSSGVQIVDTEELDLANPTQWTTGSPLPKALDRGSTVQFRKSFLLVGGYTKNDGFNFYSDLIYEYNLDLDVWNTRNERLKIGRDHTAAFLVPDSVVNCF